LDANTQDPLFPVWRYHPFFTNTIQPATQADITHRQHAICETVWSDLIDGPWAHQPSGSFPSWMGAGCSVDSWRLVAGCDPPPRHDRPERRP
jgi:hypothetical protein